MRRLVINKKQWHEMRDHVASHAPLEACGLLAGRNDQAEKVITVRNQAQSPLRFMMEPYDQLKAFEWIESNGLDLLGIFHSHPAGPETISATDITEAAYDVIHLIWSLHGETWKPRAFWIENGTAEEVPIFIREE